MAIILLLAFCIFVESYFIPSTKVALLSNRLLFKSHINTIKMDSNDQISLKMSLVDLEKVGEDIEILPPQLGVTKIVMKFGGSSLANAERITYVTK
jgi:hypothetical protein